MVASGPSSNYDEADFNHGLLGQSVAATIQQVSTAAEGVDSEPKRSERDDGAKKVYPLSVGQQAFWFHHELAPDSSTHNVILPVLLLGSLNADALRTAFERLAERHSMLRVAFDAQDGKPVQRVHDKIELPWTVVETSGLTTREIESQLVENSQRPFDLRQGPPLRLTLYAGTQGPGSHVLLIVMHHIAIDFWSLAILLDELGHIYRATLAKTPARLPLTASTYFDFVAEERSTIDSPKGDKELAFWRRELAGLAPLTSLPTDQPRPADLSSKGASHVFEIDAELAARIRALARTEGTTLFTALLAAFKVVLHRYSGDVDLAVGTPTSGRSRARFAPVVGYFVNPVVVRTRVDEGASFRDLLQSVSERCRSAFAHRDYPFPSLVEKLRPQRSKSHHPLFQVMFALQQSPLLHRPDLSAFALCDVGATSSLGDLEMASMGLPVRTVEFDLNVMLAPRGDGLAGTLEYNTSLFLPETAKRLARAYVEVLEAVTENPRRTLREFGGSDAPAAAPSERLTPKRCGRSLCELFERQVGLRNEAAAVVGSLGEEISYRELNRRANLVAHQLHAHGAGPGTVVAMCLLPSLEQVVCALAILKSGAAYLPLDAANPQERIGWMLDDSGALLLIAAAGRWEDLPCPRIGPAELLERADLAPLPRVRPKDLAYLMYTSGSMGRPKGVMVAHEAIVDQVVWRQRTVSLRAADRVLLLASPTFDISLWELFGPLAHGAQVVIAPPDARLDRGKLAELIRARGVTVLQIVSSALAQLIDEPLFARCDSLRVVFCGGDQLTGAVAERLSTISRAELVHLYGPTEAVIDATYHRYRRSPENPTRVPIGRPVEGMSVHLLDDGLRAVPEGASGEIHIGGGGLAWGYLGQPGLTARQFVPDPFSNGGRLYRTGDLARSNEAGELEFLGRRDGQVKIRGYRVELAEVEAAMACHPHVRDQAAATRQATDQRLIIGYAVSKPSRELTPRALGKHLATKLPDYMLPAELLIVDEIPRLPSGKVDRRSLALIESDRARSGAQAGLQSQAEQMVAEVWSELLELKRVPARTNFFELGGHSLMALQVAARLRALTGSEIPVRAVFDRPTVRSLGAFIVEREREKTVGHAVPNLTRLGADEGALSFGQEGLWLVGQLEPGGLANSVPQAYRLEGPLDTAALERAIAELIRHHDSLRTTFPTHNQTTKQAISRPGPFSLPYEDLRAPNRDGTHRTLATIIKQEALRPFDLTRGPLFRTALVRVADQEYALLINTHHIICDGWSQALLLEELSQLYRCLCTDGQVSLAAPGLQYLDFTRWEREWLTAERRDRLAEYWLTKLQGARTTLLPTQRRVTSRVNQQGATCVALLDKGRTSDLRAFCRDERATLFMGLVAVFAVMLHRFSGETDLVIGTPVSVRDLPELEGVVGNFVNILPLRIDVTRALTFRELLGNVRDEALQSYAHRQFPFGLLVRELKPERRANEIPLLGVVFQLETQPAATLDLPGLVATRITRELDVAPPYLNFTVSRREDGLEARVDFAPHRIERTTVESMIEWYTRLLREAVTQPTVRLASVLRSLERGDTGPLDEAHTFSFERDGTAEAPRGLTSGLTHTAGKKPGRPT